MLYHAHPKGKAQNARTFCDLELTVKDATRVLREQHIDFDAIIVTGVSGIVVGAPLALRLRKNLLVLRKDGDQSHGGGGRLIGEGLLDHDSRVLFVDDFIYSGDTLARCERAIKRSYGTIIATFEYREGTVTLR